MKQIAAKNHRLSATSWRLLPFPLNHNYQHLHLLRFRRRLLSGCQFSSVVLGARLRWAHNSNSQVRIQKRFCTLQLLRFRFNNYTYVGSVLNCFLHSFLSLLCLLTCFLSITCHSSDVHVHELCFSLLSTQRTLSTSYKGITTAYSLLCINWDTIHSVSKHFVIAPKEPVYLWKVLHVVCRVLQWFCNVSETGLKRLSIPFHLVCRKHFRVSCALRVHCCYVGHLIIYFHFK